MMSSHGPCSAAKDLRWQFLANQNYYLMCALLDFADQYISGRYHVTNSNRMSIVRHKKPDFIITTSCDICFKPFKRSQSRKLYCRSVKSIVAKNRSTALKKFSLHCFDCYLKQNLDDNFDYYELYPRLHLSVVEELCTINFVNCYMFNIDLTYVETKTTIKEFSQDVFECFQSIVYNKKSNEQIVNIKICTLENTLVNEHADGYFVQKDEDPWCDETRASLIKVIPNESNIVNFLKNHVHFNLTYYYEVYKKVYNTNFDYDILTVIPLVMLECNKCSSKIYKKKYIILYCASCGFTNPWRFPVRAVTYKPNLVKIKNGLICYNII
ncbi:ME53 [Adoxophyes honmai nucleopolyhedrovirus]|uniref:ME53 n=1 Tax=Adoxophyes honmai nucleopolyhedrovirus TaxID=224399 RepID=Q80LS0_NPVAH|nr:ME53 [Adoxophyes honmai nucleopolyhedrovirus]BAC67277.1 ME53 [Adoxophyes honmai nucleopolyhedrovirus]